MRSTGLTESEERKCCSWNSFPWLDLLRNTQIKENKIDTTEGSPNLQCFAQINIKAILSDVTEECESRNLSLI